MMICGTLKLFSTVGNWKFAYSHWNIPWQIAIDHMNFNIHLAIDHCRICLDIAAPKVPTEKRLKNVECAVDVESRW